MAPPSLPIEKPTSGVPGSSPSVDEAELVMRLRNGDEVAFAVLVDMYHLALVRVAQIYVHEEAIAEDVAQETWLAVLRGIDRFEGRSSLKTWIFSILMNRAKHRAQRESRVVTVDWAEWAAQGDGESPDAGPTVDPARFLTASGPYPDGWRVGPYPWEDLPEQRLLSQETQHVIRQAVARLPAQQQEVITLRDIEGWPAGEVCTVLNITDSNQRVLLHRARAVVRQALENYLKPDEVF